MHISARSSLEPVISFAVQGEMVKLKTKTSARGGGRRDVIRGMSKGSRSRMMQLFSRLDKNTRPLFVTLTYRAAWSDVAGSKRDFRTFQKKLFRAFPGAGLIWKLEFQERGAPHFHFFLWGVDLQEAREFIPLAWVKSTGEDLTCLRWHYGTLGNGNEHCVQPVKSWNGVKHYASKYIAKREEHQERLTGRIWGAVGRVPYSRIISFKINMADALTFRRNFFRAQNMKRRGRVGFWGNGYKVDWLILLDYLVKSRDVQNIPDNFPPGWWKSGIPAETEVVNEYCW